MFTPNMPAFWQALVVSILATPFMFLTLALFAVLAILLSRIPERKRDEE
jgi:hypothetical protein